MRQPRIGIASIAVRAWGRLRASFHGLALACVVLCGSGAQAQTPALFVPVDAVAKPTAAQSARLQRLKAMKTTGSVVLVRVELSALQSSEISIDLPDVGSVTASRESTVRDEDGDVTWSGVVKDPPGQAIFALHDGNLTGTIQNDSQLFSLEPLGEGLHALIVVKVAGFPPDHPPSFRRKERYRVRAARDMAAPEANAMTEIDVLVAYTPAARDANADIVGTIKLAVAEANQSYRNSGVQLQLKLVDKFLLDYTEGRKSFDTILAEFKASSIVRTRRNSSAADVAVLIVDKNTYCGLADAIMASASSAFAIVYHGCATGYYSFAHEIGHLLGARHNTDSSTQPFAFGHGFRHDNPGTAWRTIMSYDCPTTCQRLQYWSSPNLRHNGFPMGSASRNDNARVLNLMAASVAAFRP